MTIKGEPYQVIVVRSIDYIENNKGEADNEKVQ